MCVLWKNLKYREVQRMEINPNLIIMCWYFPSFIDMSEIILYIQLLSCFLFI